MSGFQPCPFVMYTPNIQKEGAGATLKSDKSNFIIDFSETSFLRTSTGTFLPLKIKKN